MVHKADVTKGSMIAAALVASLLATTSSWAQPSAPEPPPPTRPWHEAFGFRAFADGYASVNYNFPKPAGSANARTRAFDRSSGFALAWAGVDLSHPAEPVGGTLSLRYGPAADLINGDEPGGLKQLQQAYASWAPGGGSWTFDFGKFYTIYGAEPNESQDNINYSRSLLYLFLTPQWHTGLRVTWEASESVTMRFLAVNGYNRSIDNNVGKTFGAQLDWAVSDNFGLTLGWLGGPEQDDSLVVSCPAGTSYAPTAAGCTGSPGTPAANYNVDRGGANDLDAWRHLIDLIATWDVSERLSLVLNANLLQEGLRNDTESSNAENITAYGVLLGGEYQVSETWQLALRGTYMSSTGDELTNRSGYPLGVQDLAIATGTFTIGYRPTENLVLRLENRGDFALSAEDDDEKNIFQKDVRGSTDRMLTTTLGVVVTTN